MARVSSASWSAWLPLPWHRWRVVREVAAADEVPRRLPHRGAAVVANGDSPTWVAFDCPCRRGHRLMINLDPKRRPVWRLVADPRITLRPSVDDVTASRRCHFVLNGGRVRWARAEEADGAYVR